MNDAKFVSIFQPYDVMQAGFIRSALEDVDILCYINNENFSSVRMGGMGLGIGGMTIMVPDNQAEQAIEIIKQLEIE